MPVGFPTTSSAAPNVTNLVPAKVFNHWRSAVASARNNSGDARILCIGDSTTAGFESSSYINSNLPSPNSYPYRLATLLANMGLPAVPGLGVPITAFPSATDARWSLGSGWAQEGSGIGFAGGCIFGTGTTGTLSFVQNPQVTCDGFYVYYATSGGLGTIVATATGGSATNLVGSGSSGTGRTLVSCGSAGTSNSISMTSSGGNVFVFGIEPVLSTKKQLYVGNAGIGSTKASQWCVGGSGYQSLDAVKKYAPDLSIIMLGINDGFAAVTPATYASQIQSIITACQVSGDAILMSPYPNGNSSTLSYELQYRTQLSSLAAANNCMLLDISARWGDAYNSNYMYSADQTHGDDQGYWDNAQFVASNIIL